jgi:ABC-type sugar transport system ATPase subunit
MVFQSYALYPHMDVYRNMAFSLRLRGLPKKEIDQRVREVLGFIGLAEFIDRMPSALSGGQRRRVAIARVAVSGARLWLLDEPFTALDETTVAAVAALIAEHRAMGGLAVMAAHGAQPIPASQELDLSQPAFSSPEEVE